MKYRPLSQEGLKLIACVTMLLDHIGAVFFPQALWLRVIGRIAFPIYCFLLAEGAHYTKSPGKYVLRLFMGLVLSEIPFDLCLYGHLAKLHQSVMVTLLLSYLMILCMKKIPRWAAPLVAAFFALLAEICNSDYGAAGVLMAAVFWIAREMPERTLVQWAGIGLVNLWLAFQGSIFQIFALASMIPISLYSGKKTSHSKTLQWGFYLFYPVHLLVLWLLSTSMSF